MASDSDSQSRRALLFSGHMIDAPGRSRPRFPPALEAAVDTAIRSVVDRLQPSGDDVAICSGACGGDLLFAEAVLDRGVPIRMYLPFDEATFLDTSVNFANARWAERFHVVARKAQRFIAPDMLGRLHDGADPFERTNQWMLDEALRLGSEGVSFVCVWNGEGGDGPGGTKHMIDTIRARNGEVNWIDIRTL